MSEHTTPDTPPAQLPPEQPKAPGACHFSRLVWRLLAAGKARPRGFGQSAADGTAGLCRLPGVCCWDPGLPGS